MRIIGLSSHLPYLTHHFGALTGSSLSRTDDIVHKLRFTSLNFQCTPDYTFWAHVIRL